MSVEPPDRERPNVSGDLPTVFRAAPLFRRSVAGYDRFQVDTYVQWAEEEIATGERERERLVTRLIRTRAAVRDARKLLSHSAEGGQLLRSSRRVGAMLAAAADEAERIRAEAEADRTTACARARRTVAQAERVLADARAEADRLAAGAAAEVDAATATAARLIDQAEGVAERTVREARAEAEARLEKVATSERLAAERAERVREQALEDEAAARLRARDGAVRMLATARDERRRADDEAAAARARLDREAAARRACLLAEIEDLEQRRAALLIEVPSAGPSGVVHGHGGWSSDRLRSRLVPWRPAPGSPAHLGARPRRGPTGA